MQIFLVSIRCKAGYRCAAFQPSCALRETSTGAQPQSLPAPSLPPPEVGSTSVRRQRQHGGGWTGSRVRQRPGVRAGGLRVGPLLGRTHASDGRRAPAPSFAAAGSGCASASATCLYLPPGLSPSSPPPPPVLVSSPPPPKKPQMPPPFFGVSRSPSRWASAPGACGRSHCCPRGKQA